MKKSFLVLGLSAAIFVACDKDDEDPVMLPETKAFTVRVENVSEGKAFFQSGVFNTPIGDDGPGPATPGKSYEFSFHAGRGH